MKSEKASRNYVIYLVLTAILSCFFSVWIMIAFLLFCFYQYFMTGVEHRAFPLSQYSELLKPLVCPACYEKGSYGVSEEQIKGKMLKRTCSLCSHSAMYSYSRFVK